MQIRHKGQEYDLHFNENGAMFYITDDEGEIVEWLCGRHEKVDKPNQCWLDGRFLAQFSVKGIVECVLDRKGQITRAQDPTMMEGVVLCDIIHPEFNDDGYSPFGDFCRSRLGQQCQYGSRYIDGRLEGYPNLGKDLRFNNGKGFNGETRPLDATDYHAVRIHRDDMDEFERRYKAFCEERLR